MADVAVVGPGSVGSFFAAQLIAGGIAPRRACDVAIARAVTDDAQVQEAVAAIVDVILP